MSAEIIRFIRRPGRLREPTDFPTIAFRSPIRPDDLTMDRTDEARPDDARSPHDSENQSPS